MPQGEARAIVRDPECAFTFTDDLYVPETLGCIDRGILRPCE